VHGSKITVWPACTNTATRRTGRITEKLEMKKIIPLFLMAVVHSSAYAAQPLVEGITPEQEMAIQKALTIKTKNEKLQAVVEQAKGNIAGFLEIESCISRYNGSSLNSFAAPGKKYPGFNYIGVMFGMKYHSKSSCLTVKKIQGWEMPAKNALSFEVLFVADDSGESAKRWYKLQQQENGDWLFM
jgi:hypothetical protein